PERREGMDWARLEEEDREGGERRDDEADDELGLRPDLPPVPVSEPERRDDERRELGPRRERAEDPSLHRRRGEEEAEDQEGGEDRGVRVGARHVLREGGGGPGEAEGRGGPHEAEEAPDEPRGE